MSFGVLLSFDVISLKFAVRFLLWLLYQLIASTSLNVHSRRHLVEEQIVVSRTSASDFRLPKATLSVECLTVLTSK